MQTLVPVTDVLTRQEINELLKRSDTRAWTSIGLNWMMMVGALWIAGSFPHLVTILLAAIVVAGRQLGLVILMHDCAHHALFRSKRLNEWIGEWLCGAPMIASLDGYRTYHLKHHKKAGTTADPDLANYQNYPVSRASLRRKIFRDLSGQTGVKNLLTVLAMAIGLYDYSLAFRKSQRRQDVSLGYLVSQAFQNLGRPVLVHLVFASLLFTAGIGWTYGLWWLSYLTLYQLFLRIRNAAEHAAVDEPSNPHPAFHTRTTKARWWERLTVAPNYVNFHIEHHLLPAVPGYRLPYFHKILTERSYLPPSQVCHGYGEVLDVLVRTRAS